MSVHITQLPQTLFFKEYELGMTFHPGQGNLFLFGLGHTLGKGLLQLALR